VACIGPKTADAADQFGMRVDVVPDVHTAPGLFEAMVARFAS
jgi:uroporphyrinogen-III synthase